jgi:predicted TIM-barrel fold metal-dependent hydrolase
MAGAEKILFGTDYPLLKPARYFRDMDAAGISDTQKSLIGGENARNLLGLPKD